MYYYALPLTITPELHNAGTNLSPYCKIITYENTHSKSFDVCNWYLDVIQLKNKLNKLNK
ncbi:MAG: hypothetical protein P8X73_17400 [Ignavibacteriaceae bacterium]